MNGDCIKVYEDRHIFKNKNVKTMSINKRSGGEMHLINKNRKAF